MSLEEIFAQAILTGGVTILNCSVVIGSNAQVSDFLQNTPASTQNLKVDQEIKVDPRLKTEKAALIWKTLTEHKYIHTEGSWYVWDRTQAEYGYMVYIVSDILGVKHPANNTIMWKPFHALFLNASHIEGVAKASVSNNISQFSNYNAWCNEAKNIRRILLEYIS